jgi:hypothetical protein
MQGIPMRWPVAVLVCSLGVMPAVGCRSCDLVEAELRTRDREVRELKGELNRTELFNDALQRELHAIRGNGASPLTPEAASQTYTLKEIVLGRQTGGYDDDGKPGDEALEVMLEPRDPDGHAIKAPGALRIDVSQISSAGLKTPLSSWEITPDQLRRSWRTGLFSTGYDLVLPWQVWPTSTKLRVTARFTLADGRVFEADRDVSVRLPPEATPERGPVLFPEEMAVPLAPETPPPLLPPPRPLTPDSPVTQTAGPVWAANKEPIDSSWRRPGPGSAPDGVRLLRPVPGR